MAVAYTVKPTVLVSAIMYNVFARIHTVIHEPLGLASGYRSLDAAAPISTYRRPTVASNYRGPLRLIE